MSNELIKMMPYIVQDIKEFIAITDVESKEFKILSELDLKDKLNQFPQTAEDEGLRVFEEYYRLRTLPTDTIEDRRFRVIAKMNERVPITEVQLRRMLATLVGWNGYSLTIDDLVLTVYLTMDNRSKFNSVLNLLYNVVPVNILMRIIQIIELYCSVNVGAVTVMRLTLKIPPYQSRNLTMRYDGISKNTLKERIKLTVYPLESD